MHLDLGHIEYAAGEIRLCTHLLCSVGKRLPAGRYSCLFAEKLTDLKITCNVTE
jgi:hypothetical protein